MSNVAKTTVYLNAADYRRLQSLARAEGRSAAELIREAVSEYAQRHGTLKRPRTVGAFRSGRTDLSERAEELLKGFGGDR
jgi:hypothetical protein